MYTHILIYFISTNHRRPLFTALSEKNVMMQHLRVENFDSELAGLLEVWKHLSELFLWSGTFASFYFVVRIWSQNWALGMGGFRFATKHLQFWVIKLKLMLFHLSCYIKTGHCLNIWLQFTHSHKTMCLFLLRDTLRVDLVPIVWHTAPPKVRIPRIHCRQNRPFFDVFLEKKSFPGKTVDFHL